MKKNLTLLLCLIGILGTNLSSAQCDMTTAQAELDANNIRARLPHGGSLWWDGSNDGKYIAPKDGNVSALFAGGLWIGGFDPGGNLRIAASTYGKLLGEADYWAGPLTETGTTTASVCNDYDRFWEMTHDDILTHRADFEADGTVDGPIPERVLAWPGRGNPNSLTINGFELPVTAQGMAPFVDVNADGLYTPQDGDYPDINNAESALWYVFNDAGNVHTESEGEPLNFEIQVLAYAYVSGTPEINNSTFYDYKIVNRGIEAIDSTFVGLWIDPDLGCILDDYFGCSPERDLVYTYNSDALDGLSDCDDCLGIPTYCETIPMLGIKVLDGPLAARTFGENDALEIPQIGEPGDTIIETGMTSFTFHVPSGISPPPIPVFEPSAPAEYYSYLNGRWTDDTRMTVGGDGFNPNSTDYTNYVFPDNPADPQGWSMCGIEAPSGDRRIVMGMGGFRLEPGAVNTFSLAVVFVEDVPHPCPDLSILESAVDLVEAFYDNNPMTSTEEIVHHDSQVRMQPNPLVSSGQLILTDLGNQVENVNLYNIDGQLLRQYEQINAGQLTIERGDLPPGLVIYKLTTKQAKVYTGKILVH